jgi:hypothetical protein
VLEQSRQAKLAQRREQYEATLRMIDNPDLFAQSVAASKLLTQATALPPFIGSDSGTIVNAATVMDPVDRERERLAAAAFERIVSNPKVAVMYVRGNDLHI